MSNFAPVSKRHLHNGLIAMRVSDFLEGDKGKYQSGQMGQTVNLLGLPAVVRIHPCPPLAEEENASK